MSCDADAATDSTLVSLDRTRGRGGFGKEEASARSGGVGETRQVATEPKVAHCGRATAGWRQQGEEELEGETPSSNRLGTERKDDGSPGNISRRIETIGSGKLEEPDR